MARIAFASFALAASLVTGCIVHDNGGDDTGGAGDRATGHQDAHVSCVGTGCSALGGALQVHFTIHAY